MRSRPGKSLWIISAIFLLGIAALHSHTIRKYGSYANKKYIQHTLERKLTHLRNPGFEEQLRREKLVGLDDFPYGMSQKWLEDEGNLVRNNFEDSPFDTIAEMGPSSVGGRTRAIHIDPLNPDHVIAGGISGGIWVSNDRGVNWQVVNDRASNLTVSSITYNPFNPQILYYSTGESRGGGGIGEGIFKSVDNGETFEVLPATLEIDEFRYSWKIAHSQVDPNTIYVGTYRGLFRSSDAGDSWSSVLNVQGKAANDVLTFQNGTVMVAIESIGIFISPNGDPGSFVQVDASYFPEEFSRIKLAYCSSQQNFVYAMFAVDLTRVVPPKIFRSIDFGTTWEQKATPLISGTQGRYNMMLGVHPTNPSKIVMGTVLSAWSDNGGTTWFFTGISHSDFHEYAPFPDNANQFLVGNDGGIYLQRWNDIFVTTERKRGYNVTQFYSGSYHPESEANIGGTQDNGTIRVKPGGQFSYVFGADGGYAHVHQQEPDNAYFSTQLDGLFRITGWTEGQSIPTSIMHVPMRNEGVSFINTYEMNYADGDQLYYKTHLGMWRSKNKGDSWQRMSPDTIRSIARLSLSREVDPALYFVGKREDNLIHINRNQQALSSDIIEPFFQISNNSELFASTSIKIDVHPNNNSRILFANYNYTSNIDQCWMVDHSNDGQTDLINVTGDFPENLPVNVLLFHPEDPDNVFLAATDFGLYYTLNAGQNWIKEERMPNVQIFDMRIRESDGKVFFYTYGRGIWSSILKLSEPVGHTLPYTEDFESGNWHRNNFAKRSNTNGRVKVESRPEGPELYFLNMDMSSEAHDGGNCSFTIPIDPGSADEILLSYFYFFYGNQLESAQSGVSVATDVNGPYTSIRSFRDLPASPFGQDLIIYPVAQTGMLYFKFEFEGVRESPAGGIAFDEIVIRETEVATAIQQDLIRDLKIYPIPASEYFTIELPNNLKVEHIDLYDANGRVVKSWAIQQDNNVRLEIDEVANGNYFLRFSSAGQSLGGKQVIINR